jgi:hypothetical protein
MKRLVLSAAFLWSLGPSLAAAADLVHYAVIERRMEGARGTVRTVQVHETASSDQCLDYLRGFNNAERLPNEVGELQRACVQKLPYELEAIEQGKAVPGAFHVKVEAGAVQRGVGILNTHNLFFYSFYPGTPAEVCARLTSRRSSLLEKVTCTQPN